MIARCEGEKVRRLEVEEVRKANSER